MGLKVFVIHAVVLLALASQQATAQPAERQLDRPFIEVSIGSDHFQRLASACSVDVGDSHLLAAVEVQRDDGPWQLASKVKKNNVLLNFSGQAGTLRPCCRAKLRRLKTSIYTLSFRSASAPATAGS